MIGHHHHHHHRPLESKVQLSSGKLCKQTKVSAPKKGVTSDSHCWTEVTRDSRDMRRDRGQLVKANGGAPARRRIGRGLDWSAAPIDEPSGLRAAPMQECASSGARGIVLSRLSLSLSGWCGGDRRPISQRFRQNMRCDRAPHNFDTGWAWSTSAFRARMCAGPIPQQPPIIVAPCLRHSRANSANLSGVRSPSFHSGQLLASPLLG